MSAPSTSPPEPRPKGWYLAKWALHFQEALLRACAFWWVIDHPETKDGEKKEAGKKNRNWDRCRAWWVLGTLLALIILWFLNPAPCWARISVGFVAAYRLFEILVTGLGTALGQKAQVRARSLITIGLYAVQVTLIFAILYHSFAMTGFAVTQSDCGAVLGIWDYLYISWASITSLGNETFAPITAEARFLEVGTTTAGIFLFGVLLAFGINEAKGETD